MKRVQGKRIGTELSKVLPVIIREVTKRQESVLVKSKLTIPQVVVLDMLLEKDTCNMGDLSGMLGFTMSAATAIIDKMVRQKLVKRERCTEDRRIVRVLLLRKGKEIARKIRQERKVMTDEMFSVLTDAERKEYLRLIKKVYAGIIRKEK